MSKNALQDHIAIKKFDDYKNRIDGLKPLKNTQDSVDNVLGQSLQTEVSAEEVENTQNKFGLTKEDIESIGQDIEKNFPIMASPAIHKLLSALGFQEVYEDPETKKLILEVNQYEVVKTMATKGPMKDQEISVIRMPNHLFEGGDYGMFRKFSTALRSCFPGKHIPFTLEGLDRSVYKHGIYSGDRSMYGQSEDVGELAYTWIDGVAGNVGALCVSYNHYGHREYDMTDRRSGFSLFPYFG